MPRGLLGNAMVLSALGILISAGLSHADIHGFSAFAAPNSVGEKSQLSSGGSLTLTNGGYNQAASMFCKHPQDIRAFRAAFTYIAKRGQRAGMADGLALVFENDPRKTAALGAPGSALGFGSTSTAPGIENSAAVEINLYKENGRGIAAHVQGNTGQYNSVAPVRLNSGHPIRVKIAYNGVWIREQLTDTVTGKTCLTRQLIDIPSAVGSNRAYVGFSAGSGALGAVQTVEHFYFISRSAIPWKLSPPVDFVQPLIGTGTGPGGSINLFPGPSMPFGMVQLSPNTEVSGYGYHSYDPNILGFSMTHMSGPGCNNDGDIFFTATTGAVHTRIANFESPYSHAHETARAGYYRVDLPRWGIQAALTATTRCGAAKFTFPAGRRANVLVPISETLNYTHAAHVQIRGNREITGYDVNHCFCGNSQTYKIYFVMKFSQPFAAFGTWAGKHSGMKGSGILKPRSTAATQVNHHQWIGAYVSWPAKNVQRVITVKIGISYVSLAGAENNLSTEAGHKSFTTLRRAAFADWNRALSVITVHGSSRAEKTIFYTSLYHSLLMPNTYSDANGEYRGFDGRIHRMPAGHIDYADYSGWDIYRSEMPLLALIAPQRMADMCQSIVLMYQQGGWIDRWPQVNHYTNVMCGSPLTTVMCTAWDDGLHGFDMRAAWRGMYKDATMAPPPGRPYQGESNIGWINKLHFDPDNYEGYGSVSQIQEDCIAYAAMYHLAKRLDKPGARKLFYKRALYFQNVFDHQDHFFRPRLSNGRWKRPFSPMDAWPSFIEGSGWHYQWLAPCDMAWLVKAVGTGRFNRRLERFFSYKQPGWMNQYYNPYNEPDLEAPFEFDFSGKPWLTQAVVRKVLRQNYTLSFNGVPGNDDCGEMSSWAVMTMMGLYAMDPAQPVYEISSPLFRKITIHLQHPYSGRRIVIRTGAHPLRTPYIRALVINGKRWPKVYVPQKMLVKGAALKFKLSKMPNRHWGAAPADAPPSIQPAG